MRGYVATRSENVRFAETLSRKYRVFGLGEVGERECKDQRKREGKGEREIPQSLGPRSSADLVLCDLRRPRRVSPSFSNRSEATNNNRKINGAKKCCNAQKYKKCCSATKMYKNVAVQHRQKIIKNKCKKSLH